MKQWTIWAAVALLLLGLRPAMAEPAPSASAVSDQAELALVSAVTAVGDAGRVQLGLWFQLKPGWKIYWRSPGDAGLPPTIDWKGSDNLAEAVQSWPAPHRFSVSGLETLGYKDEVVLPIIARLNDPAAPLALRASVDYLICETICVPQHADLALDLPAGPAAASDHVHLIGRFLAAVPGDGAAKGLHLVSAEATDAGQLKVVVAADPPLQKPDLFVERSDETEFGPPKVRLSQGGKRAVFLLRPSLKPGDTVEIAEPVTLTVVDGDRAMEVATDVGRLDPGNALLPLLGMLWVALLGGFILNLMPCVLPVLSIKVLSLISHAGAERRAIRTGFLASAAGIVTSFLVLAVAALIVKTAGASVGWGIQFQQPLFLVAMVVVVTLFSANLFGFFEISLPQWAGNLAGGDGRSHGLAANFAAGAFASLLATPCSAPFLGTAVGFALARGPVEILAIFSALGLGMALPYLAVAAWPGLAGRLPRPGRWMVVVRRAMGMVLAATAIWLLAVLASQAGARASVTVAVLMVATLAVLALGRRLPHVLRAAAVVVLTLGAVAASSADLPRLARSGESLKGQWQPFDRDAIAQAVADGKTVFVDVTADWCITCQVNKATVIYRNPVAERLHAPGVVAMQADWTRPDEAISAYLASFGRYGIPFNAVYGPGAPDGIALPELLSAEVVLDALERAKKPAGS